MATPLTVLGMIDMWWCKLATLDHGYQTFNNCLFSSQVVLTCSFIEREVPPL